MDRNGEVVTMSKRSSYTVSYQSDSHFSVITQMWGSSWPKVLPYCILNVLLMALLIYLDDKFEGKYSIELSTQGHNFMTLVVSFLLVSRVNIGLGRFTQARDFLGIMYREQRELIQNACVLSDHCTDRAAKEWRFQLAYRAMILLKCSMAVIDYPSTGIPAWDVSELTGEEEEYVRKASFALSAEARRWAHGERSEWEETMRVPIHLAYLLRKTIHAQSKSLRSPLVNAQENKLLGSVDAFMGGYYGIRKFLTTPVPFPLIQMARTFLFVYVFTVPFVLLADESSNLAHCITVFVMTYGFMSLEIVAIELDDPFGDDDNDFDNEAMALTAFEDTYLTLRDIDGSDTIDELRLRMQDRNKTEFLSSERSWLMSKIV